MFNSVRWRLVAWQLVILLAVIAGFGAALFWQVRRATWEQLDADLLNAAQALSMRLQQAGPERDLDLPYTLRRRIGPTPHDTPYFVVFDNKGKTLFTSGDVPDGVEPEPRRPPPRSEVQHLYRDHGPFHEAVLRGPGNTQIVVGRATHREFNYFRSLLMWIVVAGLAVLAVGAAGAWWLARVIVAPITSMAETAERISAANLAERIEVLNPRDEPGRLATVLNRMFDRLQQAFERQTRFTADASHELRTPVAVVLSHAELALAKERTPAEYREALDACYRASSRMKTLVENLLLLARADAGQLDQHHEPVDLKLLVEANVALVQPLAAERNIQLTVELKEAAIWGNPEQLAQVVANLLTNAIKYNRDHGTVHITLNWTDREAVLTVTDTGIGIEAADLKKVFERFYRADPSRSGARAGTGLGLAICREIVDIHGGHIDASSQPGVGATLTVRLPLTEKPRVG